MKERLSLIRKLTLLTQLCVSIAVPILLFVCGSLWLQKRFALGSWIVILGILLGVVGVVGNLINFIRAFTRDTNSRKTPPTSFNDHQ